LTKESDVLLASVTAVSCDTMFANLECAGTIYFVCQISNTKTDIRHI